DKIVARMDYTHPIYTPDSVAAQSELPSLNTDDTVFAGAYHGWGFHEDGCRSGVDAALALGVSWA
ncbi:MAG: amine oxidase, partial [Aeromicrobium sp.]